jgi:hypothetical protein
MKTRYVKIMMLFLTTIISVNLVAQNAMGDTRDIPAVGIKAGINIANLYDTQGEDFSNSAKIGLAAGAFLSIPIGPYLGFQPEVIYSQKGYKGSGSISLASYKYTRNVDYLDIPLLLQIKPSPNITIVAGPLFSFLLHKRVNFESGTITVEQQTQIRNNNIRKNMMGATAGLDISFRPVIISGRVGMDLQHNKGDGTSSDPRYKNVWIQTTLGFVF